MSCSPSHTAPRKLIIHPYSLTAFQEIQPVICRRELSTVNGFRHLFPKSPTSWTWRCFLLNVGFTFRYTSPQRIHARVLLRIVINSREVLPSKESRGVVCSVTYSHIFPISFHTTVDTYLPRYFSRICDQLAIRELTFIFNKMGRCINTSNWALI